MSLTCSDFSCCSSCNAFHHQDPYHHLVLRLLALCPKHGSLPYPKPYHYLLVEVQIHFQNPIHCVHQAWPELMHQLRTILGKGRYRRKCPHKGKEDKGRER